MEYNLRTAKVGGYVKDDVDELLKEFTARTQALEAELVKKENKNNAADAQEIAKYRSQVDNLQEKLNASNNALRAAKKENDELKKQLELVKAGGAVPAGTPNNQALDAAKREIDNLKNQLAVAQKGGNAGAGVNNSQAQQAIEAAKKEIDNLRAKLKAAESKQGGNPAADAELAKTKQELTKANADLKSKTDELSGKVKEIADKTSQIKKLTDESKEKETQIQKLTADVKTANDTVANKDKEIEQLKKDVEEAKNAANNPALMMNALFVEANNTVTKLKEQAKEESEKQVEDAKKEAEKIISEAGAKAKSTIDEANIDAEKINVITNKVKDSLLSEIENVNSKFNDLTQALTKLTGQASEHMVNAQKVIDNAKKAVKDTDVEAIKPIDSSKFGNVSIPAKKEEPEKDEPVKNNDPFANVANSGYNAGNLKKEEPKPDFKNEPVKQSEQPKPAPQKKASFNFDMSELLKAAEEEAAKSQENE